MDLGLLQAEAAQRVGVEFATYQTWEQDGSIPTAPGMGKVVAFLGHDPTPLPDDFPGRLTVLRRRLGQTQADLARTVRVDPCTVSSWETGTTMPPRPLVDRLAGVRSWFSLIRPADPRPGPMPDRSRTIPP